MPIYLLPFSSSHYAQIVRPTVCITVTLALDGNSSSLLMFDASCSLHFKSSFQVKVSKIIERITKIYNIKLVCYENIISRL
jgi:hypothetical protein